MALKNFKQKLYKIIFEAETPKGKLFDVLLLWAIILSIVIVILESIQELKFKYGEFFFYIECFFTIIFSIEYILRIYCVDKPLKYIFSFYGLVDLLAIIPSILGQVFTGAHSLIVIRAIRLLRIFRLFKLTRYVGESQVLLKALNSGRHKITVFLLTVITIALFMGAIMYLVEGEDSGFTSIPKGMYWAIVTMTTVGYGDLVPQSDLGRFLASFLMIMGYGIIAVPTGIVSAELTKVDTSAPTTRTCQNCLTEGHELDATYCYKCGEELKKEIS